MNRNSRTQHYSFSKDPINTNTNGNMRGQDNSYNEVVKRTQLEPQLSLNDHWKNNYPNPSEDILNDDRFNNIDFDEGGRIVPTKVRTGSSSSSTSFPTKNQQSLNIHSRSHFRSASEDPSLRHHGSSGNNPYYPPPNSNNKFNPVASSQPSSSHSSLYNNPQPIPPSSSSSSSSSFHNPQRTHPDNYACRPPNNNNTNDHDLIGYYGSMDDIQDINNLPYTFNPPSDTTTTNKDETIPGSIPSPTEPQRAGRLDILKDNGIRSSSSGVNITSQKSKLHRFTGPGGGGGAINRSPDGKIISASLIAQARRKSFDDSPNRIHGNDVITEFITASPFRSKYKDFSVEDDLHHILGGILETNQHNPYKRTGYTFGEKMGKNTTNNKDNATVQRKNDSTPSPRQQQQQDDTKESIQFLPAHLSDIESAPPALAENLYKLVDRLVAYRDRIVVEREKRKGLETKALALVDLIRKLRQEISELDQAQRAAVEHAASQAMAVREEEEEYNGKGKYALPDSLNHVPTEDMLISKLHADVNKNANILKRAAKAKQHEERARRDEERRRMFSSIGFITNNGNDEDDNNPYDDDEYENDDTNTVNCCDLCSCCPASRVRQYRKRWHAWKKSFHQFINRFLDPFERYVRHIEAFFGSTTSAYFDFFSWIVGLHIIMVLITLPFGIRHWIIGNMQPSKAIGITYLQPLMPSSYTTEEAIDLAGQSILVFLILIGFALHRWITSDLTSKAALATRTLVERTRYANLAFAAIDFRIRSLPASVEASAALGDQISLALHEDIVQELIAGRSFQAKCKIILRRFVGITLSIGILLWFMYVIAWLIISSGDLQTWIVLHSNDIGGADMGTYIAPLIPSLVPLGIAILNSLLPGILVTIATLEAWDDHGHYVTMLAWRLYIAQTASVLIQILAFMQLADPYFLKAPNSIISNWIPSAATQDQTKTMLTVRAATARPFVPANYSCRMDAAADGLIQIMISQFFAGKVLNLLAPVFAVIRYRIGHMLIFCFPFCAMKKGTTVNTTSTTTATTTTVTNENTKNNKKDEETDKTNTHTEKPTLDIAPPATLAKPLDSKGKGGGKEKSVIPTSTKEALPTTTATTIVTQSSTVDSKAKSVTDTKSVTHSKSIRPPFWPPLPPFKMIFAPEHNAAIAGTKLLYFTQISLLSFVYVPLASLFALLLLSLEFIWESIYLQLILRKPRRPWNARTAGPLFSTLFLITLGISAAVNAAFLTITTFPKDCALSSTLVVDAYSSIPWYKARLTPSDDLTTYNGKLAIDPYCVAMNDIIPAYALLHGWRRPGLASWEMKSPYYQAAMETLISTGSLEDQRRRLLTTYIGEEVGYWLDNGCRSQCETARTALQSSGATVPADVLADANWCSRRCATASAIILDCGNSKGGPKFVDSWDYLGYSMGWVRTEPAVTGESYRHPSVFVAANVTRPCSLTCGAYASSRSGIDVIQTYAQTTHGIAHAVYTAIHSAPVLWGCVIILTVLTYMQTNTAIVRRFMSDQKETDLRGTIATLERELLVTAKRLSLYNNNNNGMLTPERKKQK